MEISPSFQNESLCCGLTKDKRYDKTNGPARVKRRMQWEARSKPLAVDDHLLLPEREVHAEIGINWFLDREIPKGGYVRILAESILWEEHLG